MPLPPDTAKVSIPILEVLQAAGIGGIVVALINQSVGWLKEFFTGRSATKRDSTYSAMRLAVVLEGFAFACLAVIEDNELHNNSMGTALERTVDLPSLPEFPADVDWKILEAGLASSVLALRNELLLSGRAIDFWEIDDPSQSIGEANAQAGLRGYRAWELASRLRRKYRLPALKVTDLGRDVASKLKSQHDSVIENMRR